MSKPAYTYQQQLNLLVSRGLTISDQAFALHALEHHNYYRLSAYRFSFTLPGNPDSFRPGTTFTDIWNLYHFDRSLRQMVLEGCKRIEISTRARLAYVVGHTLGALSYLDNTHFRNPDIHFKTLITLNNEISRSKEAFIKHHRSTLNMYWPPIWVLMEVSSFGTTSKLLDNLKVPAIRQQIANTYQLDEKLFCSLFHYFSVLRNTAAHHSRLWNRKFPFTIQIPHTKPSYLIPNFNTTVSPLGNPNERRIYNSLVFLVHLIQVIEPRSSWPRRLTNLFNTLDAALFPEMDFPPNWRELPLWSSIINADDYSI